MQQDIELELDILQQDLYEQMTLMDMCQTQFEVFPTTAVISGQADLQRALDEQPSLADDSDFIALSARSWDADTGIQYKAAVPQSNTCFFQFYAYKTLLDLDIQIDWGDGSPVQALRDMDIVQLSDIPFDGDVKFALESGQVTTDEFDPSCLIEIEYSQFEPHIDTAVYMSDTPTELFNSAGQLALTIPANTQVEFEWNGDQGTYTYTASWTVDGQTTTYDNAALFDYRVVKDLGDCLIQADEIDGVYSVLHEYENEGKYIVTIYSSDIHMIRATYAFNITIRKNSDQNLISRVFGEDLKFSPNIRNMSHFAQNNTRIQRLKLPRTLVDNLANVNYMFQNCKNLVRIEGDEQNTFLQHAVRNLHQLFYNCANLTSVTNFALPAIMQYDNSENSGVYRNCSSLSADVLQLLPRFGFATRYSDITQWFDGCSSLTCSDWTRLGNILWNDGAPIFRKTDKVFAGCSPEFLANVPASWNGTMFYINKRFDGTVEKLLSENGLTTTSKKKVDFGGKSVPSYYSVTSDWTAVGKRLWANSYLTASGYESLFSEMPEEDRAQIPVAWGGLGFIVSASKVSVDVALENAGITDEYSGHLYFNGKSFHKNSVVLDNQAVGNSLWNNESLEPYGHSKLFTAVSSVYRKKIPMQWGGTQLNIPEDYVGTVDNFLSSNSVLSVSGSVYFNNTTFNPECTIDDMNYVSKVLWAGTKSYEYEKSKMFLSIDNTYRAQIPTTYGGLSVAVLTGSAVIIDDFLLSNYVTSANVGPLYFGNKSFHKSSTIADISAVADALWDNESLEPYGISALFKNITQSGIRTQIPLTWGGTKTT